MVQQYISQLRKLLADEDGAATAIVTRGRGYELRIPPDDVDASRFVRLVERGAARQALALWRGGALDDIADEPFAAVEIRRLEELRLNALEQAIDADLADGRHGELVAELEALVAEHPLSERLRGQLMLALYRSGRQAEALEAYRRARDLLVEEVGIEPGSDLQRLHAAMLRQDASLDAPPRPDAAAGARDQLADLRPRRRARPPAGGVGARPGRHRLGRSSSEDRRAAAGPGWRPSWRARCTSSAASCSTAPAATMPRGASRARHCSSSTTPTQRRPRPAAPRCSASSRTDGDAPLRRRAHPARPARRRRDRGHREAPRAGGRGRSARRTQRRRPGRGASHRRRMGARAGGTSA